VRFGFSLSELKEMDLGELGYWADAAAASMEETDGLA
jgi:hypothetical protein